MASSHAPTALPTVQVDLFPKTPLYGTVSDQQTGTPIGWDISPEPFYLTSQQVEDLQRFGTVLWKWMDALDQLYQQSVQGQAFPWVSQWLNQGKPEALLQFGQMKRFKNQRPLVLRPDLLITEEGWALCEVDAIPGGIGFTTALNHTYRQSGFSVIEAQDTMAGAFGRLLKSQSKNPDDTWGILVSDEAQDYRAEWEWMVNHLHATVPDLDVTLLHPRHVDWEREELTYRLEKDGPSRPLQGIYQFFELFDLPNIPKIELIQYALKKGKVQNTPPWKPWLEEKTMMALLHHPVLASYWGKAMGGDDFHWLKQWVPPTWVLDPRPLPPSATVPNLTVNGEPVQHWSQLENLSQKQRQRIIKPAGFSPEAWGSRGVVVGHDVSQEEWNDALKVGLQSFGTTPHLLQDYWKPKTHALEKLDPATGTRYPFQARMRLCPYYMVIDGVPELTGILATGCPQDKKIIHGMSSAILAPCAVAPTP